MMSFHIGRFGMLMAVAFTVTGCGGADVVELPTAPTRPVVVAPPVPSVTIDGVLTATNSADTLAGAVVDFNGQQTVTTDGGAFTFRFPASAGSSRMTLSGPGLLTRLFRTPVISHQVRVDVIRLGAPFDLAFYRQFARNQLEGGGTLQPIRRWTQNPNVYIKTVDEAGRPMDAGTVAQVEAVFRDAAPAFSGNAIQIGTVERGTETRVGQTGWLTVRWPGTATDACGRAQVGVDGGYLDFDYRTANCRPCPGAAAIPRTIMRHELGHALGFWHTDTSNDVMGGHTARLVCDQQLSARERYHGAIAYARPVGNVDPDTDP